MEPFIIEEFVVFFVLVAGGGIAAYFLIKAGLNTWCSRSVKTAAEDTPREKIARIIAASEKRLAALREALERLERQHARLDAGRTQSKAESEHWRGLEAECQNCGEATGELRTLIRRRLEAERLEADAADAEAAARTALDEIRRNFNELERKIVLARATESALKARMLAAEIRHGIHADSNAGTDAVLEELENETIASEARAEADEETHRLFRGCAARVTEDDVSAEIARMQGERKEQQS